MVLPRDWLMVGGLDTKRSIFILQPCFCTQNTQFFQLLWWAACQSAGCGRPPWAEPCRQIIFETLSFYDSFYPPPDEVGAGVLASPQMSVPRPDVRISFPEQNSCYPCMDFCNFRHAHPLGGVDVPFWVFEIFPAWLADHRPLLTLICLISDRPLLQNKMCGVR